MTRGPLSLLLTCEHAGAEAPPPYDRLFRGCRRLLATHRGYDIGALSFARVLAQALHGPLIACTTTRLLVDVNRSPTNPRVFSEQTRALPLDQRRTLLRDFHAPHRTAVERAACDQARRGGCVHVAVHSFTPKLAGKTRTADVGLLYDPGRPRETTLCDAWKKSLRVRAPELRVRRNYPYRGVADGLPTLLRRRLDDRHYCGVELEINQQLLIARKHKITILGRLVAAALQDAMRALQDAGRSAAQTRATP